eukprot:UN07418
MIHHAFKQGLSAFYEKHNHLPKVDSMEDADEVCDLSVKILNDDKIKDETKILFKRLARCSSCVINPMADR